MRSREEAARFRHALSLAAALHTLGLISHWKSEEEIALRWHRQSLYGETSLKSARKKPTRFMKSAQPEFASLAYLSSSAPHSWERAYERRQTVKVREYE